MQGKNVLEISTERGCVMSWIGLEKVCTGTDWVSWSVNNQANLSSVLPITFLFSLKYPAVPGTERKPDICLYEQSLPRHSQEPEQKADNRRG